MSAARLFLGLTFLLLTSCLAALAQSGPIFLPSGARPLAAPLALSSFVAAHDSLMSRVAQIRAQTTSIQSVFKTTQGTLHRRVKSYAVIPQGFVNSGTIFIKRQIIKHRYGIELEKVLYRDTKGHKLLTERYEGHQLTRLELFEYSDQLSTSVSKWLFVRGDYLRYTSAPILQDYKGKQQNYYFFRALPAGQ